MAIDPYKNIRDNLARAKAFVRRDALIEALDLVIVALITMPRARLVGTARYELEVSLDEILGDISRVNRLQRYLPKPANNRPFTFKYIKGKEELIATALGRLVDALYAEAEQAYAAEQRRVDQQRQALLNAGQASLDDGEATKARILWRRYLDEHAKDDPIPYSELARRFLMAGYSGEALGLLELGRERFPKERGFYVNAIDILTRLREYDKAEQLYVAVIRQFGMHPNTLVRLAQLYYDWRRKDKAALTACRALELDPNCEDARIILAQVDGRA